MEKDMTRRDFLGAAAGAAAFTIVRPGLVKGAEANGKIKLGLIGCGGRGTWLADIFAKHGGYEFWAAADYFEGRVNTFGEKYAIPAERRFSTLSGYKKLLESGVEAVAVETPAYFHPEQAAAGVEAGCHVYVAKPVAVDIPGCKTIEESGKKATEKGLCFLVDFQTRTNEFYIEAVRRVHEGMIGEIAIGEATYHCDRLGIQAQPGTPEARLLNWFFEKTLSGDIITEQNIHTLDVMNWVMGVPPLLATGTGGRKVRVDVGDCWDHFAVLYQYPNGVGITFSSRQFAGYGTPEGIKNRMFGSKGVLETEYGGNVMIRGENSYRGGKTPQIYYEGAAQNVKTFYDNITGKKYDNPTVAPSVTSNRITILGRTAAYENRQVSWEENLRSESKMEPDLKGLKA